MKFKFRFILQLALLYLLVVIPAAHTYSQPTPPVAVNGVIDLRGVDLSKEAIKLNGQWGICWQRLCEPGNDMEEVTHLANFPDKWKGKPNGNEITLTAQGYASYKLTILLPKVRPALALEVPDAYTSYKLFVNDEVFAQAGKPDSTAKGTIPHWIQFTRELKDQGDTLHLILQVANFVHSKGGPYKSILIGNKKYLLEKKAKEWALDFTLMGAMIMCALFFFGLYFFGRHDKAILYFALFALTYSYRIIGSGQYALHSIYPDLPWWLTTHLEYLTLFVSVIFFTQYTQHLYPQDTNKYITRLEMWACLLMSAITLLFPPSIFSRLINPFLFVMFSVIAYTFYVYIRAYRSKRLGAGYALMSTAIVAIVTLSINLQYFGVVAAQKELLFLGYLSFIFLQSLILSYRYSYILHKARKDAEEGLMAKSDFLSNMSHEIRTPLNSVIGLSNILLEKNPREDQKEQLNVLLFSANNLLAIVNDILDYNKIEAGKINFEYIQMDLVQVAQDLLTSNMLNAREKGIDLVLEKDPSFNCKIIGDPTRLSQVIGNLLQNAIKFTRKGHVKLRIIEEKRSKQHITLTIKVEDTGIGIAPDKQKLIFERFTQADTSTSRSFGGTGLGLAICKRILELQGSQLRLESELGKGSVFYFTQTFPISQALSFTQEGDRLLESVQMGRPLAGVFMLMAEDNELNVLVAKTFLEKWGATIDVAVNGEEALKMLDPSKHDMILMDMHMPVMDGYVASAIIRERGIQTPIIALTASLPTEVEDRSKALSINAVVTKPFLPESFLQTILSVLGNNKRPHGM